ELKQQTLGAQLAQLLLRLAKCLADITQKGCGRSTISDTVITGKSQSDHRTDAGLPDHWHNAIGNAPHGKDRRLRRSDNGAESVDVIHAKIADGEGRARDVIRAVTACARSLRHTSLLE